MFLYSTIWQRTPSAPFVVGRKNWLFCDSVKSVQSGAIVYSLVETAKANDIEPYDYLMPREFPTSSRFSWKGIARAVPAKTLFYAYLG